MLKKLIKPFAFLVILGILVAGGVIRTQAITGSDTLSTDIFEPAVPGAEAAAASDWVNLTGTVGSWQDQILTIVTDAGESILVEGRGGRYLSEKGFTALPGERVILTGFYEGDDFEVAIITHESTGVTIRLRGEDGRPVWGSGGGGQ
jgi:hypothetical protein